MQHIAVIDIGKTNAKLVLFDATSGSEIQTLSRENSVLAAPPYPHHDIDGLWAFICDGLKNLHAENGVDAISITTHGATAVLMADDQLAMPVLDYEYDGPEQTHADYLKVRPEFSESLSPDLPIGLNLGAQIFYQRRNFPARFDTVTDILMYPQYWAFRLTGKKASEVTSLGVHTDLWSPDAADFSSLVDKMGWRDLFPDFVDTRSIIGTITSDIAKRTGLNPDTPVAAGIHDSNASLLPYLLASDAKISVISSGTWTITMSPGQSTQNLDENRDSLANVDAFGRPVPTARFMGGREFSVLMGDEQFKAPDDADLAHVLDRGIMVLPGFSGEIGPFPHHVGRWIGGPENLTAAQKLAAVSLYLALMTSVTLDLAGCGDEIMIEGPLARNRLFCEALSAFMERPVRPSSDATGTSLGAAMLFDAIPADAVKLGEAVAPLSHERMSAYKTDWLQRASA